MDKLPKHENLDGIREQIDEVDREIVVLLNKRMALALGAGAAKLSEGMSVPDMQREDEVLRHVDEVNQEVDGVLSQQDVLEIYLDFMRRSRNAQSRVARGEDPREVEEMPAEWSVSSYIPGLKTKKTRGW